MKKQFLKKAMASALISGATILVPSMCEKTVYPNETNLKVSSKYSLEETINKSTDYRALRENKELRNITKNHKPRNVVKTYPEIVSYNNEIDTLFVPKYQTHGEKGVPKTNCSRYARFSLEDLFGLKYNYDEDVAPKKRGAWNLKYYNPIVAQSEQGFTKEELEKMVEDRVLQPGMMVLFYNPNSNYRNWKDKTGKKVDVTHVGGFIGNETSILGNKVSTNKMRIINQLEADSRPKDMSYFLDKGWKVKYILDAPKQEDSPNLVELPSNSNNHYQMGPWEEISSNFNFYLTKNKS